MADLTVEVAMVCPSTVEWSTFIVGSKGDCYEVRYGRLYGRFDPQYGWTCKCKGFRYRGTCRHVEQAKQQWCGWNVELEPCSERHCPRCGQPTVAIQVGV